MNKLKSFALVLAILTLGWVGNADAFLCNESRNVNGPTDSCWASVTVASNETTLVSSGTVLVYDVSNAVNTTTAASYQVRVADASADGVFVAGVAQRTIASGETALVLVRGSGELATKSTDALASGNAVFVSTSGDASIVTSNTQNQLGFALDDSAASTNARRVITAYITID